MSTATLADIITKVRKLTGTGSTLQLTDSQIIDYINSFYLYDFPAEFRSLQLKDTFTINTLQNIDTYPFDFEHYTSLEAPAFVNKRLITLYQSPWPFYSLFFNWQQREAFATGNGTSGSETGSITVATQADPCQITSASHGLATGDQVIITDVTGMTELNGITYTITRIDDDNFTLDGIDSIGFGVYTGPSGTWTSQPYSGTLSDVPIIRSYNNNPIADTQTSSVATFATGSYPPGFSEPNPSRAQNILITANTATGTLNVTDDGNGNLIGDATSGAINYLTGAITNLRFSSAVPSGTEIFASYNPANQAIPQAVLFWKNQITLRPVPDQGYTVEIAAYRRPSQILLGSVDPDSPNTTGLPELLEWWETLAAGASKKIFEDRQDVDGIMMMDKMLAERYALNETRTYAQLGKQQIGTIFSDQIDGYGGGFLGWGGNSG